MNPVIDSFHASLVAPGTAASQAHGLGNPSPNALAGESATSRALNQAQSSLSLASLQAFEAARSATAQLATYKQAAARYQYAIEFAAATRRKALAAQNHYDQISAQLGATSGDAQQSFVACKQSWQAASRAASDTQIAYQHYRTTFVQATSTTAASRRAAAAETAAVAACNHALAADDAHTPLRQFTQLPHALGPRLSGYPALESEVARSQAFRRSLSSRLSAAG